MAGEDNKICECSDRLAGISTHRKKLKTWSGRNMFISVHFKM